MGTTEQTDNTIKESTEDTARKSSEELLEHHTQRDEVTGSIRKRVGSDIDAAEQFKNVIEKDCSGEEIEMKSAEETVREADAEHRTETDEEAGSIVLHVGNDMVEKEQTDIVSGAVCHEDEIVMEYKREEAKRSSRAAKKTLNQ